MFVDKMEEAMLLPIMYRVSVYGLIAIGGVVLISGIIGCHGTIHEQPCSLITVGV